jgi:TolB protein
MNRLLALLLAAATLPTFAAEPPTITISKSEKLTLALNGVQGETGKILQNDLAMSGYFKLVPTGSAAYTLSVSSQGARVSGQVQDRAGKIVLNRTLEGSPRQQAHRLADEIVETLTGNPGIASSKIAFVANRTGHKEIYTADVDGFGVVQLTHDNNISVAPSLRPDGKALVYTGYKSGYADVYQVDLTSGGRRCILKFPGTNSGATYSPDGSQIAVTLSKDGNPEIYVTSASGDSPRRVTRTAGSESSPTWGPNGSDLIFASDDRGTPQLFRSPADGGRSQLISTGHSYNTEPNWSPDGKKVAFTVRDGGAFAVAILELESGQTRVLGPGQDPVWGPDSRHLIFASGGSLIFLDAQSGQRTTLLGGLGSISEPTWSR